MCKSCKMDPAWEKVYRIRQGEIPISDFDDEIRYRKPGKGYGYGRNRKRKRPPKTGCPANNNKSHVWVWTTEYEPTDIFYKHYGFHKKETKVCCGCLTKGKTRETDEYMRRKERVYRKVYGSEFGVKRGEPVSRYRRWGASFWAFRWEDLDPEYKAKIDEWYEKERNKWLFSERLFSALPRRY